MGGGRVSSWKLHSIDYLALLGAFAVTEAIDSAWLCTAGMRKAWGLWFRRLDSQYDGLGLVRGALESEGH